MGISLKSCGQGLLSYCQITTGSRAVAGKPRDAVVNLDVCSLVLDILT